MNVEEAKKWVRKLTLEEIQQLLQAGTWFGLFHDDGGFSVYRGQQANRVLFRSDAGGPFEALICAIALAIAAGEMETDCITAKRLEQAEQ